MAKALSRFPVCGEVDDKCLARRHHHEQDHSPVAAVVLLKCVDAASVISVSVNLD